MNIQNDNCPIKQIIANQQSAEQTTLLNAIRNKFANNENHSGTSPPVFSIPNLKLTQLSAENSLEHDKTPSKLNQFILRQMNESKNPTIPGTFAIPNLQIADKLNEAPLTLSEKLNLNITTNATNIISLNKGISDLQVCDENKTHIIDLTTALNRMSTLPASPKQTISTISGPIDFQIPFIDCDLKEAAPLRIPIRDEYCQADVSGFVNSDLISAPSTFGKITCLKYRLPRKMLCVDHSFKSKHVVTRFGFDTKSPDDIILASLRKYTKV